MCGTICCTMCCVTSRLRTSTVRRPSLPLTERDEQDLALLRTSAPHREALRQLTGEPVGDLDASEAMLLHAVFEAGLAAVRAATEALGYAELAAQQTAESATRKAEARRRRPAWVDEP
jgi:hypothetical protein